MAEKIFTVDKFLGLNESADGSTELKLGEAQKIENFYITDGYNLASRPGIRKFAPADSWANLDNIQFHWSGYIGDKYFLMVGDENNLYWYCSESKISQKLSMYSSEGSMRFLKVLQAGNDVYLLYEHYGNVYTVKLSAKLGDPNSDLVYDDLELTYQTYPYVPLVVTECLPAGGGKKLEKLNILTDQVRVQFTSQDKAKEYVLPEMVTGIRGVHIGGVAYPIESVGWFAPEAHSFVLKNDKIPEDGVEVVFVCTVNDEDLKPARERFLSMPYHEYFNGATDTRIFFYGDGSNVCYYSGIPAFAFEKGYGDDLADNSLTGYDHTSHPASLYVPAGNEIAVDFSDSPITAMVRHYSRLLVFKPDGTDAITYEPVTLEDGSVIAGFYLRPVNREFGNDAPGQVTLINNNPRSFSKGSIYEWRISSGYRDERNAKCISQKVVRTMAAADPAKLKAFDDGVNKTYYVFLNDEDGTVLVNRYDLDAWSIYKSHLTRNVSHCLLFDGKMFFLNDGTLYYFDPDYLYDEATDGGDPVAIDAVWESGFHSFGADYLRKHSSRLWLSILPQAASGLDITVRTDKSSEYLTKTIGYSLMDFAHLDFSNFSFLTYAAPKIRRVQMKVKKFVYYKLILRLPKPGTRVTVLGYDQQVRYSSNVK